MMRPIVQVILLLGVGWMNSLAAEPEPASARGLLLVTNKGDQTLSIIDPEEGRQIATVKESGFTGHEVAASHDGRLAFVPILGGQLLHN